MDYWFSASLQLYIQKIQKEFWTYHIYMIIDSLILVMLFIQKSSYALWFWLALPLEFAIIDLK